MKRIVWVVVVMSVLLGLLPLGAQAAELELDAKSAFLMDANTGTVLYEYNPAEALAPASVTKVMTLLLIMEAIDSGNLPLDEAVSVSEYAASMGGSQVFLEPGETMTAEEMLKCVIIASANDAAVALAEKQNASSGSFTLELCNNQDISGKITSSKETDTVSYGKKNGAYY